MSQPQDVDPNPNLNNQDRTSLLAISALVLGIVSLPCGLLLFPSILAIVFGAIAMAQIGKPGKPTRGKGFAVAGLTLGVCGFLFSFVVGILIAILVPSLGRAKALANRAACASNLTLIMRGYNLYGVENSDNYPVAPGSGGTAGVPNYVAAVATASTADLALESIREQGGESKTNGDQLQSAWIMVLRGTVTGENFVCKADPAAPTAAQASAGGSYYNNFPMMTSSSITGAAPQISYGFAYPWGNSSANIVAEYWKNTVDSSIAIVGDAGPGLGTFDPSGVGSASGLKAGNSSNHGGEGQNISFADCHVEFQKRPTVGQGGDNVYTLGSTAPDPSRYSLPITDHGKPGAWDIELLPQRTTDARNW